MKLSRIASFLPFLALAGSAGAQARLVKSEVLIPAGSPFSASGVCALGDLDGDGVDELALGLARDDDGGIDRGAVQILFLNTDGSVRATRKISQLAGGFSDRLDDQDLLGTSLAPLGDLDGDGRVDLAVGAPGDDDGGADRGAVWIFFLHEDGTLRAQWKISATRGGFGGTLENFAGFGRTLSSADVDGDGRPDLCVGQFHTFPTSPAWLLLLQANGTVKAQRRIDPVVTATATRAVTSAAGFLADLDGNGVPEIVRVVYYYTPYVETELEIVYLEADGTAARTQSLARVSPFGEVVTPDLRPSQDGFGIHSVGTADLDLDGMPEVLVDDSGTGAVWVLFLNRDGSLHDVRALARGREGLGAGPPYGQSLAPVPDVDGDGVGELACVTGAGLSLAFLECAASLRTRNGTGVNDAILASTSSPYLGTSFDVDLNCIGHAPAPAFLFGFKRPATVLVPGGEFLVDLSSPRLLLRVAPHFGDVQRFHFDLPNSTAFCGLQAYIQGACFGAPGAKLSNALDLVFGH